MWTTFENWLATQLEIFMGYVGRQLGGVWSASSAVSLVFWAKFLAVVGWVWTVIQFVQFLFVSLWNGVLVLGDPATLSHLTLHVPSEVVACFAVANTFLPLDTMASVVSLYFTWSVALGTYRLVKGCIPSESGN